MFAPRRQTAETERDRADAPFIVIHIASTAAVMHSTHDDVVSFRQGKLPPSWVPRLEELAGKLEARAFAGVAHADAHTDSMGDVERAGKLRADLAEGRVQANDGRVLVRPSPFGGVGSLRFEGNGGPVFWSLTAYSMPIPGVWRVYLLPTSRVAVGAEGWASAPSDPGKPTAEHVSQYRAAVLSAQRLDEHALGELRAGRLPRALTDQIRRDGAVLTTIAIALAGLGLLAGVVLLGATALAPGAVHPAMFTALLLPLAVAALLASSARGKRATEGEAIDALEGSPRLTEIVRYVNGSRSVLYCMEISQRSFDSDGSALLHDLFHLLAQGFPLRCYVARSTGTLVAIELAQPPR